MSAANPNPMETSMVSVLVVANAGGGSPLPCVFNLDIMLYDGQLHRHLLHRGGGGREVWRRRGRNGDLFVDFP
jgi:hypothetical protein